MPPRTKKFNKSFCRWLKQNDYSFKLENWCKHCKTLKKRFDNPNDIPQYKGKSRKVSVPAIFKNNRIQNRTTIDDLFEKYQKKSSSFGGINRKSPQIVPKPSGSYRPKGALDYIPQPNWGKFSASPFLQKGNVMMSRAGNGIGCQQSADWLYTDRSSPRFPLPRPQRNRYGSDLVKSSTNAFYDQRGRTGFNYRPKSIYMPGGSVPTRSYSPYTGAHIGGRLPQPYGPIDNASLKGYPNGYAMPDGRLTTRRPRRSNFGADPLDYGPFINQFGADPLDYGPFINQGYGFGNPAAAKKRYAYGAAAKRYGFGRYFGTESDRAQFRPHAIRSWKPNYNSYANKNLYLDSWNPYQNDTVRTSRQREISQGAKGVSQAWALNGANQRSRFGNLYHFGAAPTAYQMEGQNNASYRPPFHMYTEGQMGGNTVNFLTKRNYLPPCYNPKVQRLKVAPNNNPTGYLANKNVTPISGLRGGNTREMGMGRKRRRSKKSSTFGMKPWTESSKKIPPWVARGNTAQRPYTTQLFSSNDAASSGYTRIGQPLSLYAYQNSPNVGSYNYPSFSGPRNFYSGFSSQSSRKKTRTKKAKRSVQAGDTLIVKNGKIKVVKKGKNK